MSIALDRIGTLLKDVVIVRLHSKPTGTITGLFLPESHRVPIALIPGTVLKIGTKFRWKDDVRIGDTIYVPSQFGNAVNQFDEMVRFFDGEDCHAMIVNNE